MNGSPTLSPDFQRAFLAMRYFWGARGVDLGAGLDRVGLTPAAADVLRGLTDAARERRAAALASELGRLATSLDQRSLWR